MSEEREQSHAGQPAPELFTLTLDRQELAVLNQSLILWLKDLQKRERRVTHGYVLDSRLDEIFAVTRRVCEKIDTLLEEQ